MNGAYKAVVFTIGLIVFCCTVIAVLIFASLWSQRELVAWILLTVFGVLALVLIAGKVNEMTLRQKRFHHHEETPLDTDGYPTHLPNGTQPYQRALAQPKEVGIYEYPYRSE